jgi:hypothetical protein
MRLFLDICQGIGLSASAGVRPFLPTLAAGAFAGADVGVNFEHTDYAFLESAWFLVLILALLGFSVALQRRLGPDALESGPLGATLTGIAIGLGALLFAGSLADHGYIAWPGLLAGILVAAFSQLVVRRLFQRVRARLDADARSALVVYADGTSLLAAVGAIMIAPISLAFVALLALLGRGGRRREGEKYAGLRILR